MTARFLTRQCLPVELGVAEAAEEAAEEEGEPSVQIRKPGYMISLATITAMYTDRKLEKGPVRTSNWETQPLSSKQLECTYLVY